MNRTITVKGTGKVSTKPDQVVLSMTLETTHKEYDQAMKIAADHIQQLNTVLCGIGFEKSDLKTTSFDVDTEYGYVKIHKESERVFQGYKVMHRMKLTFDLDMQRLSQTLSAIAGCLAHPQLSIDFTIKDTTAINEELLRSAAINAKKQAVVLCDAAGVTMGELIAIDAALDVMGATHCIQMDTTGKNTGANIHALTTDTMIGWLGGSGMPNEHVLMWIDELLYYYTTYGVDHILNVTPGTMLACSILYRMGINVTMKGSVLMGTDNVYTGIVYLLLTRMFARDDGSVPMLGLNPSDSVNLETMRQLADLRLMLGLENKVRIEQHVTNFYKGVVAQPFVRRDLLVESAKTIPYMSAKHEGADPSIEATLEHPSNNLEFVLPDKEVLAGNHFEHMQQSFLYGVSELNKTAVELTRNKMAFLAASNLHRRY